MMTPPERDALVASIRESLKDNGRLYLADNGVVKQGTLPYHGPYIAKELIIGQMANYGFDLVEEYQPIAQRYLLVFKKMPEPQKQNSKPRQTKKKAREAHRRRH